MDQATSITELEIAPGVREVTSEDGAVLLDVEQGVCFSLNPVGLKIWELLKKGCSLEQIADALGQEFPVSRPQLVSDAGEFIAALEAKQLIRRPNQTPPKRSGFFENLLRLKRRLSAQ
jgi:hypothetical protein